MDQGAASTVPLILSLYPNASNKRNTVVTIHASRAITIDNESGRQRMAEKRSRVKKASSAERCRGTDETVARGGGTRSHPRRRKAPLTWPPIKLFR